MSLRDLYRTLSTLSPEQRELFARRLEQGGWGRHASEILPRPAGFGPIPVSLMQQRLWLMDQMEPGNPFYNLPLLCVELRGPVRHDAIERSFQEIERRHEGLRTRFGQVDGTPIQIIEPFSPRPTPLIDLSALPPETADKTGWDLSLVEAQRPFDLARFPLWRTHLIRVSAERHLLLMCFHHIISDAWSVGVFYKELMKLYSAFLHGRPSPLPELPIQYPDYSIWQRQRLQGELLEEEVRFWKELLADAPELIELPLDRPRPARRGFKARRQLVPLPPELPGALAGIAVEARASLYIVLLAAFKTLLHRYSGQTDLVLGAPVAGRNNPGTESLIGFLVNTIVFRTYLGGDPTFAELVDRVRSVVLDVFEHSELPFDRIVEEVQPRRDPSYGPVYQAVFSFQNTDIPDLEIEGTQGDHHGVDNGTGQTDLILFAGIYKGMLGIMQLEYNTEIFDDATILRLQGHLLTLVTAAVADRSRRLSDLPLLGEAEQHQTLREWNDTLAGAPADLTMDRWFEQWAAANPDHLAVVSSDQRWTYAELDRRSNQIAHRLQSYGAGPELKVAICMERSPELIAAVLGVLKAGAAYLPLDPATPEERLIRTIEDCAAPIVVTQAAWGSLFFGRIGTIVLLVDAEAESLAAEPSHAPASPHGPLNLAYVIYTSGSTGVPKGVEVAHASLVNLLRWGHRRLSIGPNDHMTLTSSMAFDASTWEMWAALSAGATVHIAPEDLVLSPDDLVRWLDRERITCSFLATALAREVLYREMPATLALRTLSTGGDRCPEPPLGLPFEFFNLYGPTESTVVATSVRIASGDRVSIGEPIDNATVHLLDRRLHPVPPGGVGEIYIGGRCLSRGYGARPDLTADRYIPDPFAEPFGGPAGAGGRLYRTGDLARRLPDGKVDFLGRADHQVKIRGFRIELGEIEATLSRHPGVRESVVVLREIVPGEMGLAGYYVPTSQPGPEIREVRSFLEELLPEYMIPAALVPLERMPVTATGKLDRKALPDPGREGGMGPYVAPRTPVEETLADIWQEVLGVERVGVADDFFALGGHSLLAVRLIARIREHYPIDLSTRLVFQTPTLATMAESVEQMVAAGERTAEPAMVALPRPGRRARAEAGT